MQKAKRRKLVCAQETDSAKSNMVNIDVQPPFSSSRKRPATYSGVSIPSLYPIYLPLPTQHRLLRTVQEILEDGCYAFAQRSLHDVVEKKGWECAESVELNVWSSVFLSNKGRFSAESLDQLGKPFAKVLDSVTQLRHTAVHRIKVTVNRVEQFLLDAESFSKLLDDNAATERLAKLRRDTDLAIGDMKSNKDLLESRLAETVHKFAAQRAELEHLERTAVEDMLREDKECQSSVSANLDHGIASSQSKATNVCGANKEPVSGRDADVASLSEHDIGYEEEPHVIFSGID